MKRFAKPVTSGIVLVLISVIASITGPVAMSASSQSAAAIDAQCRQFYHNACSEALGEWLPNFGYSSDWWPSATRVDRRDGFVYPERRASSQPLGFQGPSDGTFFVYGDAGPPKGRVVYDPEHRIAFYKQGCCSWNDVVAAADAPSPPKPVIYRDLQNLYTVRGVRLGQTVAAVAKIYGSATLVALPKHPGVSVLAYTTWPPRKSVAFVHDQCGQFENFFFRKGRLILIQLGNGC